MGKHRVFFFLSFPSDFNEQPKFITTDVSLFKTTPMQIRVFWEHMVYGDLNS